MDSSVPVCSSLAVASGFWESPKGHIGLTLGTPF